MTQEHAMIALHLAGWSVTEFVEDVRSDELIRVLQGFKDGQRFRVEGKDPARLWAQAHQEASRFDCSPKSEQVAK